MHFLWMTLIGLAVAIAVKLLVIGRDRGDIVVTLLLGLGGSLIAGLVGRELGWYEGPLEWRGFAGSVLGAALLLIAYRFVVIGRLSS